MSCERVWMVTASGFVKENVDAVIRELEAKGFRVEKREVIFDYE